MVDKKRPVNSRYWNNEASNYRLRIYPAQGFRGGYSFRVGNPSVAFDQSLASQQSFDATSNILSSPLAQFLIWGSLAAITYHTVAGIRHLIMDLGVGEESFNSGRISAWIAVAVAVALIAALTGWVIL